MCLNCISNTTSCCSFYVFGCYNRVWKSCYISSEYKNYTFVITNWLTVTEYLFLKRQGSFPFYIDFCLSSITNNIATKKEELLAFHEHLESPPFCFGWTRVALLFCFLCCVFSVVCRCPVSCVPSVSGLSILNCPSVFSNV